MTLGPEEIEVCARVHAQYPQFTRIVEEMLASELRALPRAKENIQIMQGRCLALEEISKYLRAASAIAAKRNSAQPIRSTP